MDAPFYFFALCLVRCLQAVPWRWVAPLGRVGGVIAYWLDAPHRRVALQNMARCFAGEKSEVERRALVKENFRRIGATRQLVFGYSTAGSRGKLPGRGSSPLPLSAAA